MIVDSENEKAKFKGDLIDFDSSNIINNFYSNSTYKKQLLYEHSYNLLDSQDVKLLNEAILQNIYPMKPQVIDMSMIEPTLH